MKDRDRDHYSNGGGHEKRSVFEKDSKALAEIIQRTIRFNPRFSTFRLEPVPIIEQARQIRRHMRRVTQDGRR